MGEQGHVPPNIGDVGGPECHWGETYRPTCQHLHCASDTTGAPTSYIFYFLIIVVLVSRFIIRLDIIFKKAYTGVSVVTNGSGPSRV